MKANSHDRLLRAFFAVMLFFCECAVAANPMRDFEATKQIAIHEQKDIILSFSGYYRYEPTSAIDSDTDDPWILEHFLILEIDIPSSSDKPIDQLTTDEQGLLELREMFHQDREDPYTTILLSDASGRPYAAVDSHEQPPEAYIPEFKEAIQKRIKRDAAFQRAEKAVGMDKAKLLNEGLRALCEITEDGEVSVLMSQESMMYEYYQDILTEIIKNDPKDLLGRSKEVEFRKEFERENALTELIEKQLATLANELNDLLKSSTNLTAYCTKIDDFLNSHPAIIGYQRQKATLGKIEAALMLRDYSAALKLLDTWVAALPEDSGTQSVNAALRPEIVKAIQLSEKGLDSAITGYCFSLNTIDPHSLFDADGTRTVEELKQTDIFPDNVLIEDQVPRTLKKIDLLIRLKNYEQALKVLDIFVKDTSSEMVKRHDRKLRPYILRGLNSKPAAGASEEQNTTPE